MTTTRIRSVPPVDENGYRACGNCSKLFEPEHSQQKYCRRGNCKNLGRAKTDRANRAARQEATRCQ